ncbi:MAG: diadenylate cyclase CdaA [Chthoniobacterales bacterium]
MTQVWTFIVANWRAAVEILILTTALYYSYLYLKGTRGARILIGLAVIFLTLTVISNVLELAVITEVMKSFYVFLIVALVVIFQPELRRALTELGSHHFFTSAFQKRETIEEITDAVFELASKGFGALLAIEREISTRTFAETGVDIDCQFSKELLLTIFHPKTALHDGGVILQGDRIAAAACIFPLTQRDDLDRALGLRHRAAIGLAEESDVVTVVVSEETGQVSICHNGIIERNLNVDRFRRRLSQLLLRDKYDEKDAAEQLEGEDRVSRSRHAAMVPHQAERERSGEI